VKIGITCYPVYGGSGVVATELGIQLARRGHEVHFITYAQPFRLPYYMERIYYHEVDVPSYPLFDYPPYDLALASAMHNTVVKRQLDILHVHYAIPHAASAWLAKEMGGGRIKVVTTLHGTDITLVGLHPSFHAITRFSILRSQGLTAVSEYLKEETVRDFQVPAERIEVIPNFIDTQVWRPGKEPCHRSTLAPEGEKIVMHVSNFRPVKRVEDVVEVFERIVRKVDARLVFVGDGPERPRAAERAEELGVRPRVLFLGKHASVDELIACADLLLLPSSNESFGLAALEAMACGAPVVATDVGGIPEVVTHGESGFLFKPGALDEMAAAGIELLQDPLLKARIVEAARTAAETRFGADAIVPRYEAHYERVIAANGSGAPVHPQ
jgi:N-acetyl-alpha-D-glucosaminyl L-malate synthase BshA